MKYTRLRNSGLKVSKIALGCMSFATGGRRGAWTPGDDAAEPIFRQALDLGITFWETANVCGAGTLEEIVGRAITKLTRRDDLVITTKLNF